MMPLMVKPVLTDTCAVAPPVVKFNGAEMVWLPKVTAITAVAPKLSSVSTPVPRAIV